MDESYSIHHTAGTFCCYPRYQIRQVVRPSHLRLTIFPLQEPIKPVSHVGSSRTKAYSRKRKHTKCVSENWVISANCHVLIIKRIRISFFKDFSLVFHGFPEVFSCHRQFVQLPPSCLNWKSGLGCASEGTQTAPATIQTPTAQVRCKKGC